MGFLTSTQTDIGISKSTNQDSFCLKVANTSIGSILMAVVCDGMGGLSKGEVASATVITTWSNWFENELPLLIENFSLDQVEKQWRQLMINENIKIAEYGMKSNVKLGTTFVGLLMVESYGMLVAHVGDSRAYKIKNELQLLTNDHTVVGRDVRQGKLTKEQAKVDPRRNVLLQCIGASPSIEPDFMIQNIENDCTYMLCSDGFRHKITEEEIFNYFRPNILTSEQIMDEKTKILVETDKHRMEKDNITVLLVRTF